LRKVINKKDVFSEIEEKVLSKYLQYSREYYFLVKENRETKIKDIFSAIPQHSLILEGSCVKLSKIRDFNANT
jgi:hypothetical protein